MAPKGRPTGSSYSTTSDPLLYKNPTSENRYDYLTNTNICVGRMVKFSDFTNYSLRECLDYQGWTHLLEEVDPVYPRPVRLFFAHLIPSSEPDDRSLSSYVMGQEIFLDPPTIAEILGVPLQGVDIYSETLESFAYPRHDKYHASSLIRGSNDRSLVGDNSVKNLKPDAYIIAKLLFDSLLPKGGDADYIRGPASLLIYCLLSHTRVNLPFLVYDCLVDSTNPRRNLPYGSLLSKIFRHFDVYLDGEQTLKPHAPFGKRVIDNMVKTLGIGEEEEEEEEEEEGGGGSIRDRLARLEEGQTAFREEVRKSFEDINENFSNIFSHFGIHPRRKSRRH